MTWAVANASLGSRAAWKPQKLRLLHKADYRHTLFVPDGGRLVQRFAQLPFDKLVPASGPPSLVVVASGPGRWYIGTRRPHRGPASREV